MSCFPSPSSHDGARVDRVGGFGSCRGNAAKFQLTPPPLSPWNKNAKKMIKVHDRLPYSRTHEITFPHVRQWCLYSTESAKSYSFAFFLFLGSSLFFLLSRSTSMQKEQLNSKTARLTHTKTHQRF
jgi:hypothetical protein